MTQADLLSAYASHRDAEAFARIVEQYQRFIFTTCRRRLNSAEDVDDAVQETFLRLAQKAGELHSNIGGWLHTCAVNVTIDINRRRQSRRRHETAAAAPADAGLEPDAQRHLTDLREHLDAALERLDAGQRDLIIQRYFLGRPQVELAAEANVAPSTITHRLDRAIDQLRHHLKALGCGAVAAGGAAIVAGLVETETASAAVPPALTANVMKIGLSGVPHTGAAAATTVAMTATIKAMIAIAAALLLTAGAWVLRSHLQTTTTPLDQPKAIAVAAAPPAPVPAPPPASAGPAGIVVSPNKADTIQPPQWQPAPAAAANAVLSGRILDHDGKPVANADVSLSGAGYATTRTDAQGNYAFRTIKGDGEYQVGVKAAGYLPVEPYVSKDPALQLTAQSHASRDIVIERGVTVVVSVTDGIGQPVRGAAIDIGVRGDDRNRLRISRQDTGAAGQVTFTLPVSKTPYVVAALAKGNAPTHTTVTPESPDKPQQVDLVVEPGFSVKGVAMCNDGKPASGWQIVAQPDWWSTGYVAPTFDIDKDGNFTLKDITPGSYTLHIMMGNTSHPIASLTMPPATQPLQLSVPHPSPGSQTKVVGRVRFVGGRSSGDLQVQLSQIGPSRDYFQMAPIQTGRNVKGVKLAKDEGIYTFDGVPPGTYRLQVESSEAEGKIIDNLQIPGEIPVLDVKVTGKPHIVGTVTDASTGQPLSHYAIRLRKIETIGDGPNYVQKPRWSQVSDPQGRYSEELVGPGVYQVQASLDGYAWIWSERTRVESAGATVTIDLKLTAGGALAGVVVDPSGKPVEGAKVIPLSMARTVAMGYRDRFETDAGAVPTDAQGHFTLPHLAAGFETVKVVHPDFAPTIVEHLKVQDGTIGDAGTIGMKFGGNVEGTVFNADGQPEPGVVVQFQDESGYGGGGDEEAGRLASATTDAAGHYRVDHLPSQIIYVNLAERWQHGGVVRRVVKPVEGYTAQLNFGGPTPLTGRLLAGGKPMGTVRVELAAGSQYFAPVMVTANTEADGRFTFHGAPAGGYTLFCEAPNQRGEWVKLRDVDVTDAPADLGDVVADTGDVLIKLTADDPADLAAVKFVVVETDLPGRMWQEQVARLGVDGPPDHNARRAANVPPGHYRVRAWIGKGDDAENRASPIVRFDRRGGVAETAIELRVPRAAATLTVHFTNVPGKDANSRPWIAVHGDDPVSEINVAAAEDKPQTLQLPAGTYTLVDQQSALPRADVGAITLKPGDARDLTLDMSVMPGLSVKSLRVTAWTADGVLVHGAKLRLADAAGKPIDPASDDSVGLMFVVPNGRYHATLQRPGSAVISRDIEVTNQPASASVDLVVP